MKSFGDRLLGVSILVRKRLDLRHVLEVHFGRKRFGCHRLVILNIEFEVIWRSFGLGFNLVTLKVRYVSCFGGSFRPQKVWVLTRK